MATAAAKSTFAVFAYPALTSGSNPLNNDAQQSAVFQLVGGRAGNLTSELAFTGLGIRDRLTFYSKDVGQVTTDGNPAAPCIGFIWPGTYFQFPWSVATGTRTISINAKQATNGSPRPSMTILSNPGIGVNSAVTGTAASSTGWVTIGPLTITPTSAGLVIVQLNCNYGDATRTPALFDHVVVT